MAFTPKLPEASWAHLAGPAYLLSKWKDNLGTCSYVPGLLGALKIRWFERSSDFEPFVGLRESSSLGGALWLAVLWHTAGSPGWRCGDPCCALPGHCVHLDG